MSNNIVIHHLTFCIWVHQWVGSITMERVSFSLEKRRDSHIKRFRVRQNPEFDALLRIKWRWYIIHQTLCCHLIWGATLAREIVQYTRLFICYSCIWFFFSYLVKEKKKGNIYWNRIIQNEHVYPLVTHPVTPCYCYCS